jgi:hypothetical protein
MRVSKRYNKYRSFNLRKKFVAVNKNKVKNQNSDSWLNIYDATRVTIVNDKVSTNCILKYTRCHAK